MVSDCVSIIRFNSKKQGLKDYFFMDGGAEGFHEAKFGKLKFQVPDNS